MNPLNSRTAKSRFVHLVKRLRGLHRFTVDIKKVRTPFGEPFNKENHWVKTLEEYDAGLRDFRKSSLMKFHMGFRPSNIFDVMPMNEIRSGIILGEYPWGRWSRKSTPEEWFESTHCGPSSESNVEKEWNRFIDLYKKICREGLQLEKYGHPLGTFLIDDDGSRFFIVLGGNHRMAIISHLKLTDTIRVRLLARSGVLQVCHFSRLKVHSNEQGITANSARALFKTLISSEFLKYEDY